MIRGSIFAKALLKRIPTVKTNSRSLIQVSSNNKSNNDFLFNGLAISFLSAGVVIASMNNISETEPIKPGSIDVILGAQWGDEGKGKLVDILSQDYDICARVGGGSNAGL